MYTLIFMNSSHVGDKCQDLAQICSHSFAPLLLLMLLLMLLLLLMALLALLVLLPGGGGGGVSHQRGWVCIRGVYIYESISHHVRARRVMGVAAEPGVSHVLPFWHRCF